MQRQLGRIPRRLDARKDERTFEREKAARDDARKDKLRESHTEFQRQTLLDLQDCLLKLIHSAVAMHKNNTAIFGDGIWKEGAVYRPNELSLLYSDAQAKSILLIGRLSDDKARDLATQTKVDCTIAYNAENETEGDEAINRAFQSFMQVNAQISKLLRELNQSF